MKRTIGCLIFSVVIVNLEVLLAGCVNSPSIRSGIPVPEFVEIPAGTFTMGTPLNERSRHINELQHEVTLSAFYMSKYEVTQGEFEAVMGFNPHGYKAPELPVDFVGWYDAVDYCNALSKLTGLAPAYRVEGDGAKIKVT
jgi:formylglycine-generating enzyme required for sulfatase activity